MAQSKTMPPSVLLVMCVLVLFVALHVIIPSLSIPSIESSTGENNAIFPDVHSVTSKLNDTSLPIPTVDNLHSNFTSSSPDPLRHPNFLVDFPLCLVHVGKAAGSSVSCGLGLTYADCEGMPRDKLPHAHFMHMRRNNCPQDVTKSYLVTLRNPVTRLQSWFDFEKDIIPTRQNPTEQEQIRKKRGMLFVECFQNFTDFVTLGLQPLANSTVGTGKPVDMTCNERAWAAALGVRSFSYHEWFNYEHYWNMVHRNGFSNNTASIRALRTEHLMEDWSTISREPLFRPVNRKRNQTTTQLNDAALANLCSALCPEIQIYKRLLMQASNLNQSQRHQSLEEVRLLCPLENLFELRECPGIPSFPLMNVPRRQYQAELKQRLFRVKT